MKTLEKSLTDASFFINIVEVSDTVNHAAIIERRAVLILQGFLHVGALCVLIEAGVEGFFGDRWTRGCGVSRGCGVFDCLENWGSEGERSTCLLHKTCFEGDSRQDYIFIRDTNYSKLAQSIQQQQQ